MAVVLTLLVLGISSLSNLSTTIAKGVYIDGVDVSGMTHEKALAAVSENTMKMIDSFEVTLSYDEKRWTISASDIGASANIESAVSEAMNAGKDGGFFEMIAERNNIKSQGLYIMSQITPDEKLLEKYLSKIKIEIDLPVTEAIINFDPSDYDYFDETMDSSMMFDITEGTPGQELDMNEAKSLIYSAMINQDSSEIVLPVKELVPRYNAQVLPDMQTLIFHSSCAISHLQRYMQERNHNIKKALDAFKGLVVKPGETVSILDIIGELTLENGWLMPPSTPSESFKSYEFTGVDQAATAIYNAAFCAGAQIIEQHHNDYPAYYKDYGYGMDVDVKYGEKDLIFKNTSDYPMFFDAYLRDNTSGMPSYVDVDVYTVPIGENMYIAPISEIVETIMPPPTEYLEVPQESYSYYEWIFDEEIGMYTFQKKESRDGYIIQTYKAVYENGVQESPGVWTGGKLISKKEYERVEYPAQQGLIWTKPAHE